MRRLVSVLPSPPQPTRPARERDWLELEQSLGIVFPPDVKEYLSRYGSGEVNGFLLVASPAFGNSLIRLPEVIRSRLEIRRAIRESGWPAPPYPIFPEPGGLLPWGFTRNGDTCFWVTRPTDAPEDWPVIIVESKSQEWLEHDGPMTALLADLVQGKVRVPFFPRDCFGSGASFVPLDPIRDGAEP